MICRTFLMVLAFEEKATATTTSTTTATTANALTRVSRVRTAQGQTTCKQL